MVESALVWFSMKNSDMKLNGKVVFLSTIIAVCIFCGMNILWIGREITRDSYTGKRWNKFNVSVGRNEKGHNNAKKPRKFQSLDYSLEYCSLSTLQSEMKGNRTLDLELCVMAECDIGDRYNRHATLETCNMFYCSKSKCGHVKCPQEGETWNRTNVHTYTDSGVETDKKSCTSFSFSSARRRGIVGGHWRPTRCRSKRKVAIIIPFRDRDEHLCSLLKNLIPILIVQQSEFRIFVVEQIGNGTFNKGRLMNGGFLEASKMFNFNCVFFHDVDLIPENDGNLYECGELPRHLSVAIDEDDYKNLRWQVVVTHYWDSFPAKLIPTCKVKIAYIYLIRYQKQYIGEKTDLRKWVNNHSSSVKTKKVFLVVFQWLMYSWLVGGVLGFRPAQFWKVNGYSNMFWGWGGEDDDMYYRIIHSKLRIHRPPASVARYTMIRHKKRERWPKRVEVLKTSESRMKTDGLNHAPYKLISIQPYTFYTKIKLDVFREDDQLHDVITEMSTMTSNVTRTRSERKGK